ncbi:RagB/SusD family nutrient uptake outer membrane protein [Membranihabitans maritimus]|uniref:RagB/SusD family nutrient uptake outer membrane protein n=1 Tax=Membranihabitans maritimus TaxID=2904244 RepID=UPI001F47BF29|nr:RagB/SusD family nutrient uptake outer membrane protein [Membranihabitans maritimus]
MKYFCTLLTVFVLSSCSENFLDINPKGELFPQAFYSNEVELDIAATGLYARMERAYVYGWSLSYATGGRDKTSNFDNFEEVDVFATEGDNGEMSSYWDQSWTAINAANEIIYRYEDANASEEKKREVAGQAHFIRAYNYFMLVRMYNQLPLYTNSTEVSIDIELSGPEAIYSLIVDDLKTAEEFLPDNWDSDPKRAGVAWTSGAAKSLLAYVYLCMAGYPLNDASKYTLAAEKAKEVIDNEAKYGYGLMENIADLYSSELNWQNQACEEVVLAFFNDNNYGCVLCSVPAEYGGWEVFQADINFFESFPEGPRKDAIFISEFPFEDGVKHYTEISAGHPFYRQYWDGKIDWERPWDGMNWKNSRPQVAITHANNLLVYAEAQAMSGSPDASTYDAINRVRNRAGLPDLPEGLSKEAFRDSVVQERAWEFCGGYFCTDPWYDLVRLERVEESVGERHPDENQLVKTPTKEEYFAPYPVNDVNKNPNLHK